MYLRAQHDNAVPMKIDAVGDHAYHCGPLRIPASHVRDGVPTDPLAGLACRARCDLLFMFPDSVTPPGSVVENGQRILRDFPLTVTHGLLAVSTMLLTSFENAMVS